MFRFIALLIMVIICVFSVIAVYYNKIPYLLDFHLIQFTNIPLGILLFVSMMIGILIATFFLIGLVFNIRKKYKILKKDHDLINKEVQNLRRIPIQE
tara:strand:+ start:188 stop:478 length:291 start_codon:yes stop_codon:yes gene_type:complete